MTRQLHGFLWQYPPSLGQYSHVKPRCDPRLLSKLAFGLGCTDEQGSLIQVALQDMTSGRERIPCSCTYAVAAV